MNYYNEFDPFAAEWLENLITEGLIPDGKVDRRSIIEVSPDDIRGFTQVHFFCGIGGWPLALRLAGWPDDRPVGTGSCPCQPYSVAGEGTSEKDERHLWPDMFRLVKESGIDVWFGEQVENAIGHGWLDGIQRDLEGEDFAVGHCVLGAHSIHTQTNEIGIRLREAVAEDLGEVQADRFYEWWVDSGNYARYDSTGGSPQKRQRLFWVGARDVHKLDDSRGEQSEGANEQPEYCDAADRCGKTDRTGGTGTSYDVEHAESDGRHERGAESGGRGIIGGCSVDVMADSNRQRLTGRKESHGIEERSEFDASRRPDIGGCGGCDSMVNPIDAGPQGYAGDGSHSDESGRIRTNETGSVAASSPWSDYRIANCIDGQSRRVGRSVFPLVNGIPRGMGSGIPELGKLVKSARNNRVGRLKGFGNAIVPQVAAEFIKAFVECGGF